MLSILSLVGNKKGMIHQTTSTNQHRRFVSRLRATALLVKPDRTEKPRNKTKIAPYRYNILLIGLPTYSTSNDNETERALELDKNKNFIKVDSQNSKCTKYSAPYATKASPYSYHRSVPCSQPRVLPTRANSESSFWYPKLSILLFQPVVSRREINDPGMCFCLYKRCVNNRQDVFLLGVHVRWLGALTHTYMTFCSTGGREHCNHQLDNQHNTRVPLLRRHGGLVPRAILHYTNRGECHSL